MIAANDDPDARAAATAEQAVGLFPDREVASSSTLYDQLEAHHVGARLQFLDGLNAYLVEDLTQDEREKLHNEADVLENIEIGLVPPTSVADNAGEEGECQHLDQVKAKAAWQKGFTGADVRIGILDTGIDASHTEFRGKSISFMEFDASGFPIGTTPRDADRHGTHVAGIAAGATCGVAPCADLAVAAVLTHHKGGGRMSGYLAQILAGYNWLAHHNHGTAGAISNCPVVNASFGASGFHNYLYSSVKMQHSTLKRSLLVAAIGNSGSSGVNNHGSPGNYNIAAGIGAVDANGIVAPFSDWGLEAVHGALKPDLCAPGTDVRSAVPKPKGGYVRMSGTSMASPAAAAAVALIVQKYPQHARNPAWLKAKLVASVDTATVGNPANFSKKFSRIGFGQLDLTRI